MRKTQIFYLWKVRPSRKLVVVLFYVKVFTPSSLVKANIDRVSEVVMSRWQNLKCEPNTSKNFPKEICVQNITLISTQDANGIVGNQTKYMRAQNTFEHVHFPISYFVKI